jgi:arabinose-5-phosphate isomerase
MTRALSNGFDASAIARRVLDIEARSIMALAERLDTDAFNRTVGDILVCRGRVIVSGVGKSGHIARKLAATLASTGTPAYFVHAAEAAHGDLGMITRDDILIALSYSGTTEEIMAIVPALKRSGTRLIALCGRPQSPLAREADIVLDTHVDEEACPLNLAPTASTTAMLALGDALAVALLEARGFSHEDFARTHPGGRLGRRLLTRVEDVMRPVDAVPFTVPQTPLCEALVPMSRGGMGMIVVTLGQGPVVGLFTDGDLRRALARQIDLRSTPLEDVMNPHPQYIAAHSLAAQAAERMDTLKISQLLVCDAQGQWVGALTMHDLMQAGVL